MVMMKSEIESKINNLQRNFLELDSLFELSVITNQSYTIIDLFLNVSDFIKKYINIKHIYFFVNSNGYFHLPPRIYDDKIHTIELEASNQELRSILPLNNIVKVTNENSPPIYKSLWEKYGLTELNCDYAYAISMSKDSSYLVMFSKKEDGTYLDTKDIKFLKRIFSYIQPAFLKLNKTKTQNEQIQNLNKALHNMSILYNISQAVNFIDDLKRLLNVILDKAIETIDAEKGSLMLYDFQDNTLQVKVVYGLENKEIENNINNGLIECSKFKPNEGIAGKVFATKTPIISNLGENDPRFKVNEGTYKLSSLLCVPLVVKGEAIGVINISNKRDNKVFTKIDLEFMEALSNQAAIAIDNAKLYELATKDGLTKLYIYRHFYNLLENEINRARRYNHKLSLLMIDIDNFKNINDRYGHLVGDRILQEIASNIEQTIRQIDIPARYGGEEFAIILPETTCSAARVIAERLRKKIQELDIVLEDGTLLKVTISVGISEFFVHAQNIKELINCADIAMYKSKNNGRNCTYEYDKDECIRITQE